MRALLLVLLAAALLLWLAGPTARGCPPGGEYGGGYGYAPQYYGYAPQWGGGYQQQQFYQPRERFVELDFQRRGLLGFPRESLRLRADDRSFGGYPQQQFYPQPYGYGGGYGGGGFRGG
jgi:hypothetical protein